MRIKKIEDQLELDLFSEGDRVILHYNKNYYSHDFRNLPKPEENFIFGDYLSKDVDPKTENEHGGTRGSIRIANALELDLSFGELVNGSKINLLEKLRNSKDFETISEKEYSLEHFSEHPDHYGIYLIR